ncbi:unnamed protein product [Ectocarpus sp. 8 AP-2014]
MTLGKRSFRILGSVGKALSTEDMSKLSAPSSSSSSSSPASSAPAKSAASSSSSVPPPVFRVGSAAGGLPRSSSPPSRDTSSTTLSGEEEGSSGAPLTEGTGGKQRQHQHQHQQRKNRAPVRARGMWTSPLRKPQQQLRKGSRLDENEAGDGGFVSHGFVARGQEQEEEEEMYWTPPNTMRTPATGPIWVGNS